MHNSTTGGTSIGGAMLQAILPHLFPWQLAKLLGQLQHISQAQEAFPGTDMPLNGTCSHALQPTHTTLPPKYILKTEKQHNILTACTVN